MIKKLSFSRPLNTPDPRTSLLLSIITVVYNAANDLEKTIKSVLKQQFKDFEYIIIDGGSTDGTLEILNQFKSNIDYCISETDRGIYDAMNKGLAKARGKYVSFLNAGDEYCNEYVLETLFANNEDFDVLYGDIIIVYDSNKPDYYMKAMDFSKQKLLESGTRVVCHQAFFVKRALSPFYDITYKYKAELNWYFDILESNPDLKWTHKRIPVVNYPLDGIGHLNYLSNLIEWCRLIIKRFGIRTFVKYKYPKLVLEKLKVRYPGYFKWLS